EGAMPDRNLAGIADQDIEAERANDGDEDQVQNRQIVLVHGERDDEHEQRREHDHGPFGDRQGVQRRVGSVGGLEDSGLALEHGYTRSIWRGPKMPYGRTISIRIIST